MKRGWTALRARKSSWGDQSARRKEAVPGATRRWGMCGLASAHQGGDSHAREVSLAGRTGEGHRATDVVVTGGVEAEPLEGFGRGAASRRMLLWPGAGAPLPNSVRDGDAPGAVAGRLPASKA